MSTTHRPLVTVPSRAALFIVGAVLVAAACGLGALIFFRTEPYAIDVWWNSMLRGAEFGVLLAFSQVMNTLGAGWFGVLLVPILGTVGLIVMKRPWSAAFFLVAQAASAAAVQVLKHLFGRARPEEIIVISDYGSFPSGHVAGAATLAAVVFILFPRLWVVIVGVAWVILMAVSRTVLHAHWLTDTIGGMLIGVGVVLIVAGAFAPMLRRERPDAVSVAPQ